MSEALPVLHPLGTEILNGLEVGQSVVKIAFNAMPKMMCTSPGYDEIKADDFEGARAAAQSEANIERLRPHLDHLQKVGSYLRFYVVQDKTYDPDEWPVALPEVGRRNPFFTGISSFVYLNQVLGEEDYFIPAGLAKEIGIHKASQTELTVISGRWAVGTTYAPEDNPARVDQRLFYPAKHPRTRIAFEIALALQDAAHRNELADYRVPSELPPDDVMDNLSSLKPRGRGHLPPGTIKSFDGLLPDYFKGEYDSELLAA